MLYSLIGTAKLNGLDPESYLRDVLSPPPRSSHQPHRRTATLECRSISHCPTLRPIIAIRPFLQVSTNRRGHIPPMPVTTANFGRLRRKLTVSWPTYGSGWRNSSWNSTRRRRCRIDFGDAEANGKQRGEGKPETFDFLGFTHISGKNRRGYYTGEAPDHRQASASQAAGTEDLPTPARSGRINGPVASVGRARSLSHHAVPGESGEPREPFGNG